MSRPLSKVAPDWWDYTTLDAKILADAARLTIEDLAQMSRPGFGVAMYDTLEDFYLAEALEYIAAWRQSTADNPVGICGPIGPTEQLPLVARLVNELNLDVRDAHFWGMDEWIGDDGRALPESHPLSFARADKELCFDRIKPELRMPEGRLHFPIGDLAAYSRSYDENTLRGDAGRTGGREALGVQRSAEAGGPFPRRAADAGRATETRRADHRPPPDDDHAECADVRRRAVVARAGARGHGRAGGDLEGGKSLHLACRQPRQPVWHEADDVDDREEDSRRRRAHVALGRPSERAVQLLPSRRRRRRNRDALTNLPPARVNGYVHSHRPGGASRAKASPQAR